MKVARGPAPAVLQQAGYTPVLVKVVNESGGTQRLRIGSPQAGPVYAGHDAGSPASGCSSSTCARTRTPSGAPIAFSSWRCSRPPPMTANLSGLEVEYAVALIYSSEAGPPRGDDRVRRRTGHAGPRVSRRGAGAVHREAGGRGEAQRARPRRHADDGPLPVRRPAGPRVPAAGEAAGAGPVFPEAHLPRGRRDGAAAAGRAHDVLRPRARVSLDQTRRDDSARRRPSGAAPATAGDRRQARALDRSGGARLLQRRPSHPRGGLRALHVADRGRRSGGHVPAGQRRGAQRRQRADVGPGLRSSAAVFRADARQAQRAADADEVRHRGQRLRVGGARPRRACSI